MGKQAGKVMYFESVSVCFSWHKTN